MWWKEKKNMEYNRETQCNWAFKEAICEGVMFKFVLQLNGEDVVACLTQWAVERGRWHGELPGLLEQFTELAKIGRGAI